MNFITRNQQEGEKLPETYVKYPHLIPFLQEVQKESTKHMYPFYALDYFYRTQNDLTNSWYDKAINRTIRLIYYILSSSYNIVQKYSRSGTTYLVFSDTRMGGISMDFSSVTINPYYLEKYSIQTKHRMDLDEVIENIHKPEEVAHIVLSYCNAIVAFAQKNHITNDFIFYDEYTSKYCKVGLDEVEESEYKQVIVFLENYWAKVNAKTGLDILAKAKSFSDKVYISEIDYIKA